MKSSERSLAYVLAYRDRQEGRRFVSGIVCVEGLVQCDCCSGSVIVGSLDRWTNARSWDVDSLWFIGGTRSAV